MSAYITNANGVACGSDLPIVNLTGSATIRVKLYEWLLGFSGSPADVATLLMLERTTDAGTGGTSLTINKLDPLTVAATATAKKGTYGVVPTDSDELQTIAINQRATHRWIAREGKEFISTASANNGIMLNSESSGATPAASLHLAWYE